MSTKGISANEPDPRIVYADIIDLPHHQSKTREPMSLYNRAAQFASFDALAGFSDMIAEEARITGQKEILGDYELEILNQKLTLISDIIEDGYRPELTITYFVPDDRKAGGRYATATGIVKRVDAVYKLVQMESGQQIAFDAISEIHGELVDYLDDGIGFEVADS